MSVIQTLQFINIDESKFVGGGIDVITADDGLWAMGLGLLDLVGSPKTSFVRAGGNIAAGRFYHFSLNSTPSGWQAGDDIAIANQQSRQQLEAHTAMA